jgi:hypothetical protein
MLFLDKALKKLFLAKLKKIVNIQIKKIGIVYGKYFILAQYLGNFHFPIKKGLLNFFGI